MTPEGLLGAAPCACEAPHTPRLVALTGGPGAGKTAVLAVARRHFCRHVVVLPESASIVYGGGFPRLDWPSARRHAQTAIAQVQLHMEEIELEAGRAALVLCDRGVPDGLAYWDGEEPDFWTMVGVPRDVMLARYAGVLHLRPAADGHGYDRTNPLRIESAPEASRIDERIALAWEGHPRVRVVDSTEDFVAKVQRTMALLEEFVPACCARAAE